MDLVEAMEDGDDKVELKATEKRLLQAYDDLANHYHTEKGNNKSNSLVLG